VTEFYIQMIARAVDEYNPPNVTFEDFLKEKYYLAAPGLLFEYYKLETVSSPEAKNTLVFKIFFHTT
jgi:hypothetical protein